MSGAASDDPGANSPPPPPPPSGGGPSSSTSSGEAPRPEDFRVPVPSGSHCPSSSGGAGGDPGSHRGPMVMTDELFAAFLESVRGKPSPPAKESEPEDFVSHPSFSIDPSASSAIIKTSPDSHIDIPDDLVSLFNAGYNIPLSLLTFAAIRDYTINMRRSTFVPRMSGRLLEEFQSWHLKDDALPLAEWCQAMQTLIFLFRSIRVPPPDADPVNDPVQQLSEHTVNVISQLTSSNWRVWREYDKRIRRQVWAPRPKGTGLPFSIVRVNRQVLDDAEQAVTGQSGQLLHVNSLFSSSWYTVVTAAGQEIGRAVRSLNDHLLSAAKGIFPRPTPPAPVSTPSIHPPPSSVVAGKRRRIDPSPSAPPSYFQHQTDQFRHSSVPPSTVSPSSAASPCPARPAFCVICRRITADHSWNKCPAQRAAGLRPSSSGFGWTWTGKPKGFCAGFNGGHCNNGPACWYGHYCSQCGTDGHRAIDHGVLGEHEPAGAAPGAGSGPAGSA
ncbi:hypothetical protein OC842_000050 [Tilletia horrida]|uniref:C3H1-type domain-containing protein n=1 Tax=Tilletia horrida TaxID=155126 RepID=A0AAN6GKG7_9BASI|nr:hypothetical protein OC842_000050 [Tilletia horrida]